MSNIPLFSNSSFIGGVLNCVFYLAIFLLGYYGFRFLSSPEGRAWRCRCLKKIWLHESYSAKQRMKFDQSLPDALQTISSSLKAGLTLKDSLQLASENEQSILSTEIGLALKEYHFGVAMEEALHGVRRRVNTSSCHLAFGAMIMSVESGGDLPTVLKNIVKTIKERQRVEGRLRTLTAQGRSQAVLLCLAPPFLGLGMYLYDESKMALLTSSAVGQMLLIMAVVLEVVGIVVTARVMKLDV